MKPITVKTIEKCNEHLSKLRANGWKLWLMQYRWNDENGFHAWFHKAGEQDIELVTRVEECQKAIVVYNEKSPQGES